MAEGFKFNFDYSKGLNFITMDSSDSTNSTLLPDMSDINSQTKLDEQYYKETLQSWNPDTYNSSDEELNVDEFTDYKKHTYKNPKVLAKESKRRLVLPKPPLVKSNSKIAQVQESAQSPDNESIVLISESDDSISEIALIKADLDEKYEIMKFELNDEKRKAERNRLAAKLLYCEEKFEDIMDELPDVISQMSTDSDVTVTPDADITPDGTIIPDGSYVPSLHELYDIPDEENSEFQCGQIIPDGITPDVADADIPEFPEFTDGQRWTDDEDDEMLMKTMDDLEFPKGQGPRWGLSILSDVIDKKGPKVKKIKKAEVKRSVLKKKLKKCVKLLDRI
jgi:hypothetical protein